METGQSGTTATLRRTDAVHHAMAGDYWALLKPRVMSLAIFTAFVGLLLAPQSPHPLVALACIVCIAVGAGAAGALNMWWDADIDAQMPRTAARPIPAGKIAPQSALAFALVLAVGSVLSLGLVANWAAAALLAFTIFFYAVIYTMWLKRRSVQNIVIGGLAGALPPAVGWCAATGSLGLTPLILVAIVFFWTPPHFWTLALLQSSDYERARIPMLPVVAGHPATRLQILVYSFVLAPCAVLPVPVGAAGLPYGVVATLGGAVFCVQALQLWRVRPGPGEREAECRHARRLFIVSIVYLFAIFASLALDSLVARLWPGSIV